MKKQWIGILMVFVLMLGTLAGCSGDSKNEQEAANKTVAQDSNDNADKAEASDEEAEDKGNDLKDSFGKNSEYEGYDAETLEVIKYNLYVEMNNAVIVLLDNIDYYYWVVDYTEDFALIPDTGLTYGYNISYVDESILDDILTATELDPSYGDLDESTKEMIEKMRVWVEVFNEIEDMGSSCADNQYARPKELHTKIYAEADIFYDEALLYLEELDEMFAEEVLREEERLKEEGSLIAYYSHHAILLAGDILDECYAQDVYDDNLIELDLTTIKPMYEELVATVDAYNAAVKDTNQLVKESLSDSAPFDGLLDSLIQSIDWMIKQVESQVPLDDPNSSALGSMGHVYEVLDDCIDRYNSVFVE